MTGGSRAQPPPPLNRLAGASCFCLATWSVVSKNQQNFRLGHQLVNSLQRYSDFSEVSHGVIESYFIGEISFDVVLYRSE